MSKLEELIEELCPDGVEYKKMGELGNFYSGLSGKNKNNFINGNKTFITYKNIYKNIEIDTKVTEKVEVQETEKQNKIEYGDILFTGSSENTEECGLSSVLTEKADQVLYLNSFCFGFRFNNLEIMLPQFSKYLFRSAKVRKQIMKTASGVTRFNVSKKKMGNIVIPVPPIEVQNEIVRILDDFTEFTGEITAKLTAELADRKKQYEYYRTELIEKINAPSKKLENVVEIYLGLTHTPKYVEKGIKFISAQNISGDFLNINNVKYISEEEYNSITENAKPKRGDILFTRVGSNLGHPVIVDTDEKLCIFVSLGFLRVKNKDKTLNKYIKHWINTDLFWSQVRKNVHGSAKVNLNTGWLKNFEIKIPDYVTQVKICKILDGFELLNNDISQGLPAEIEARKKQYEYYRNKLLTFKELKQD